MSGGRGIVRYEMMDFVAAELARFYSQEQSEPFFVAVGNHPSWDLRSQSGSVKVEIKLETTPIRTGNVALEYWNTDLDEPSGILGTGATLWLHLIPADGEFEAIEYDVPRLQRVAIESGVVKSNGRNALCKIVPLDEFRKHARRVFAFKSQFYETVMEKTVRGYRAGQSQADTLGRGGSPKHATTHVETEAWLYARQSTSENDYGTRQET